MRVTECDNFETKDYNCYVTNPGIQNGKMCQMGYWLVGWPVSRQMNKGVRHWVLDHDSLSTLWVREFCEAWHNTWLGSAMWMVK